MSRRSSLAFIRKNRFLGYKIKYLYYFFFKRERIQKKKTYGELNSKHIIYIVKPDSEDCIEGLLSLVARASLYIRFANRNGYITCVDWKNYKTQYFDGTTNAWELFFRQPSSITLSEAYKSKNVYLSGWTMHDLNSNLLFSKKQFFNPEINMECHKILTEGIQFTEEVESICNTEARRLDIKNCLGVYLRGTDYIRLKPSGEYVQPTVKQIVDKIDEFLILYPDVSIYLVTEDGEIYDMLKEKYSDKIVLVSFDTFIYQYNGKTYLSKSSVLDEDKKKRGINYLVKMILLSRCRYLISSITMGSMFSYGLNGNKYEDEFIFYLGLYS